MPRSRISYINKDVLALFLSLFFSVVLLFFNKSPQVQNLKLQVSLIYSKISYPIKWYKNIFIIKEENYLLKNKVIKLALLNAELDSYRKENKRLKQLLNFSKEYPLNYVTANVVNYHLGIISHTITIDIGSLDGLIKNLPILDENGLLGKTITLDDHVAIVQLITDKNFRVSIRVGEERTLGLFIPTHGKFGILEGVRKTTPIKEGDIVYSSGISEIYPPNIPIAKVISFDKKDKLPFQHIIVEILGKISNPDYVFVIL